MLLINYFKFVFWYGVSHTHHLLAKHYLDKNADHINDQNRFKKYGKKMLYHSKRFFEIQETLDKLKEEICDKYPDLRD